MISLFSNPQLPFIQTQQSIYVLSEKDFAKYKARQVEAEIAELERLKDGHKSSIERLERTIADLKKSLEDE